MADSLALFFFGRITKLLKNSIQLLLTDDHFNINFCFFLDFDLFYLDRLNRFRSTHLLLVAL